MTESSSTVLLPRAVSNVSQWKLADIFIDIASAKGEKPRKEFERLLWSEECFWEWNGKQAHNIAFYYLIELCKGSVIPENDEFVSHKDNCNVVLDWMPIDDIRNVIIYPKFLKKEIYILSEYPKHFVSKG